MSQKKSSRLRIGTVENYRHLWLLSIWVVYLSLFFVIEHVVTEDYWVSYMPLDDKIPFCEYFIIPYCLWHPLLAVMTAYLEYEGQIVTFEVLDSSVATGVSITKTGPKEAVSGQPVRYVFSGISNTGNISLESFYWRDTLPAAVTLNKVVTGTYNFPGTYKIVYKVNGAGDYRTLADNLSTAKNYTFDAGPAALGLAANERVT